MAANGDGFPFIRKWRCFHFGQRGGLSINEIFYGNNAAVVGSSYFKSGHFTFCDGRASEWTSYADSRRRVSEAYAISTSQIFQNVDTICWSNSAARGLGVNQEFSDVTI